MTREYSAFLLRLWRNRTDEGWRVTLRHAQTNEQMHFANVAQLVAYLESYRAEQDEPASNIVDWLFHGE